MGKVFVEYTRQSPFGRDGGTAFPSPAADADFWSTKMHTNSNKIKGLAYEFTHVGAMQARIASSRDRYMREFHMT